MSHSKVHFEQWQLVTLEDLTEMQALGEAAISETIALVAERFTPATDLPSGATVPAGLHPLIGAVLRRPDKDGDSDWSYDATSKTLTLSEGWVLVLSSSAHPNDRGTIVRLSAPLIIYGVDPSPYSMILARVSVSESPVGDPVVKVFLNPTSGSEFTQNSQPLTGRQLETVAVTLNSLDNFVSIISHLSAGWCPVGLLSQTAFNPYFLLPAYKVNSNRYHGLGSLVQFIHVAAAELARIKGTTLWTEPTNQSLADLALWRTAIEQWRLSVEPRLTPRIGMFEASGTFLGDTFPVPLTQRYNTGVVLTTENDVVLPAGRWYRLTVNSYRQTATEDLWAVEICLRSGDLLVRAFLPPMGGYTPLLWHIDATRQAQRVALALRRLGWHASEIDLSLAFAVEAI